MFLYNDNDHRYNNNTIQVARRNDSCIILCCQCVIFERITTPDRQYSYKMKTMTYMYSNDRVKTSTGVVLC